MEQVDFARPRTPRGEDVERAALREGAHVTGAEREELVALLAGALGAPVAQRIAAAAEIRHEHPFAFALAAEQPLLTGVIDLLARDADGTALVVDYKTDRLPALEDTARRADADYALQRLIYAVAVLREGVAAVEVVHWFLARPGEPATVRFASNELSGLTAELAARLRAAEARGYTVSEHPHKALCLTCPGRRLCSWSAREQLRESPT
jgi:ATP-dependent helicase/nuclease subunit A